MASPPLKPGGYPLSDALLTAIQTVVDEMVRLGYIGTGADTGNLGNLQPAVQSLIDTASVGDKDRSKHTGFDPALNVEFADTTILEQWRISVEARLQGITSGAPVIGVPTIATTTGTDGTVGSIMTATAVGETGVATGFWQWNRVNATTPSTPIAGATAQTYQRTVADYNAGTPFRLTVTRTGKNAAGVFGTPQTSAVSSLTTATLASNTVAPTITEASPQNTGVTLHGNDGTWINSSGSTSLYRWKNNGAIISGAVANSYTLITGQEGHTITFEVARQTAQGTSDYVAASNSVTVSGAAALVFTAPPAFSLATVTVDVDNPVTDATFTVTGGGTPTFVETDVYLNGSSIPYAPITVHPTVYNGHDDSYMTNNTKISNPPGLTTLAGAGVVLRQVWQLNGINYTSPASASKTIQAASAAFAVVAAQSSYSFTVNNRVTAFIPAVATGGTKPYTYQLPAGAPALPNGMHLQADGSVTGTPTNTAGSLPFSVQVTDAVGATDTIQFNIAIGSASGFTWLVSIDPNQPFASMGNNYLQLLGGQRLLSSVSETGGVTGTGNISTPFGMTNVRFGKFSDPKNASKKCFLHAAMTADGQTFNHFGRVELGLDAVAGAIAKQGKTYWFASRIYLPTSRKSGGTGSLMDIHHDDGGSPYPVNPATGPIDLSIDTAGQVASPFQTVFMVAENDTVIGGGNKSDNYLSFSNTGGAYGPPTFGPSYDWVYDDWMTVIWRYRGSPTSANGIMQAWVVFPNGTVLQVANKTNYQIGINTQSVSDYIKSGLDDLSGGGSGTCELRGFFGMAEDTDQTINDVIAAIPS